MTGSASGRRNRRGTRSPATRPKPEGTDRESSPNREDRLTELHDRLAEGVERLQTSEGWQQLLEGASRLHRYSFNNVMLLLSQMETVSSVAGFKAWQRAGRQVRKGERGLWILAPNTRRLEVEDEQTGETQKVTKLSGFRAIPVWDITQTDGPELPQPVTLSGDAPAALWDGLVGVLAERGYRVERTEIPGGAKGDTSPDGLTRIDPRGTPLEQLAVLFHETAHVLLGHLEEIDLYQVHRGRFEVEAESVAFIGMTASGLEVGDWSFEYAAGWSRRNPDLVQETATKVVKVANQLLDALSPEKEAEQESVRESLPQEM
jgi:hypothetical protein